MKNFYHLLLKIFHSKSFTLGILILVFLVLYVPYMLKGGFIIDDWGIVTAAQNNTGLISIYNNSFPLFSNRPLAPLFFSITGSFFGDNPMGYIIITLTFWFLALSIIGYVLKDYLNKNFSILFIAFASVPIIASTVVFSPGMQITATAAYLLYSLALCCLHKYLQSSKKIFYVLTFILILAALSTYEIIIPLLVLLFFLPYLKENESLSKKYFIKYGLPLILLLMFIFLYQKVIMPNFMHVYSRFNPATDPIMVMIISMKWAYATFIAPPFLGLRALYASYNQTIPLFSSVSILFLWIIFVFSWLKDKRNTSEINNKIKILIVFSLTFLASLFLLLLANTGPNITGYDNRGLSVAWITVSLMFAYIGSTYKSKTLTFLVLIIVGTSWLAFIAERDSYINSYQLQQTIVKDVISKAKQANAPIGITVLGNLPQDTPNSFNHEDLFYNPWDFGGVLSLFSDNYIAGGDVITKKKIDLELAETKDDLIMLDGYWTADYKNLWLYNYNPNIASSSIQKINNKNDMLKIISNIKINNIEKQTWYESIYICLKIKKKYGNVNIQSILSCLKNN